MADLAMRRGRRHLMDYGATTSRHDFTQRQLMTCLILRAYLRTTYRGVVDLLAASPNLRERIGLTGNCALHRPAKVQRSQPGAGDCPLTIRQQPALISGATSSGLQFMSQRRRFVLDAESLRRDRSSGETTPRRNQTMTNHVPNKHGGEASQVAIQWHAGYFLSVRK